MIWRKPSTGGISRRRKRDSDVGGATAGLSPASVATTVLQKKIPPPSDCGTDVRYKATITSSTTMQTVTRNCLTASAVDDSYFIRRKQKG